jgi:tetratricopeptide (TPR) repeat protein
LIAVRAALAGLLAKDGKLPEALSLLEAGLVANPDHPDLTNALVQILIDPAHGDASRVGEAVARMERVCSEMKEVDPRYLYTLAEAYVRQGRPTEAIDTARTALEAAQKAGRTRLASKIERDLAKLESALRK